MKLDNRIKYMLAGNIFLDTAVNNNREKNLFWGYIDNLHKTRNYKTYEVISALIDMKANSTEDICK